MFNSRSPIYRCPTGAVADGTNIHFKINLPRNLRVTGAFLCVENDNGPRAPRFHVLVRPAGCQQRMVGMRLCTRKNPACISITSKF